MERSFTYMAVTAMYNNRHYATSFTIEIHDLVGQVVSNFVSYKKCVTVVCVFLGQRFAHVMSSGFAQVCCPYAISILRQNA